MLKNLRLSSKFMLLAMMIPITAALIAGIGLNRTGALKYEYDNLYGFMFIPITNIDKAAYTLADMEDPVRELSVADISAADKAAAVKSIDEIDQAVTQIIDRYNQEWLSTGSAEFTATLKQMGKSDLQDQEVQALEQYQTAHSAFIKTRDILASGGTGDIIQMSANLEKMRSALLSLIDVNMQFADLSNASAQEVISQMRLELIIAGVVISLLALIFAYWLAKMVGNPVKHLTDATRRLAQGDLAINLQIDTREEIGQMAISFNEMVAYLKSMSQAAERMANGDMTVEIQPRSTVDVFGITLQRMVANLHEMIWQVRENAEILRAASSDLAQAAGQAGQATDQIAATMQQVARGITQQTGSITKTAGAAEAMNSVISGVTHGAQEQAQAVKSASQLSTKITGMIQQVSGNAAAVTRDSAAAAKSGQDGSMTVEDTIRGMGLIRTKVGISAERVKELGRRSEQIGTIVETIQDIASQTNMLALNAAIEAARAGEHGKGFAVVADEVRKLAERANNETKEINALISGIQATVNEAVEAMNESAVEVERGVQLANEAGNALNSILDAAEAVLQQAEQAGQATGQMSSSARELEAAMSSVSAVVEENSAATKRMNNSSNELGGAIDTIASVSEENSAAVEEVSASVEEMSAQVAEVNDAARRLTSMADTLQSVVVQFKLE